MIRVPTGEQRAVKLSGYLSVRLRGPAHLGRLGEVGAPIQVREPHGRRNRTSVTRNGNPSTVTCYKDPAGYVTDQLQSGDGWSESSFDGDGNPETLSGPSGSLSTITYNQEDEPEASYPSWGGTNLYDFDGDHKLASKGNGTTGITTYYVYDGSDVISEVASGNPTYRLPGVCEYNSQDSSPNVYQMDNGLGSTVGETADGSTSYLDSYDYDAYGVETDMGGQPTGTSNFRFRGKAGYLHDHDTEGLLAGSGLVLCGERFYVPGMGRFLNQDPIGQGGGLNLYGYCDNNPLGKVDPDGKGPLDEVKKLGQGILFSLGSWPRALDVGFGWASGLGPSKNKYTDSDPETGWVRMSAIGRTIDQYLADHNWLQRAGHHYRSGSIHTPQAAWNTVKEFWNGTQAQLGAVSFWLVASPRLCRRPRFE